MVTSAMAARPGTIYFITNTAFRLAPLILIASVGPVPALSVSSASCSINPDPVSFILEASLGRTLGTLTARAGSGAPAITVHQATCSTD